MSLSHVPDDEYDEICALLDARGLQHYRIEPSRWGLHGGALWLVDEQRHDEASALLAQYQAQRAQRAQDAYRQARLDGSAPRMRDAWRAEPLRMLLLTLALLGAITLSVLPFLWLAGLLPG